MQAYSFIGLQGGNLDPQWYIKRLVGACGQLVSIIVLFLVQRLISLVTNSRIRSAQVTIRSLMLSLSRASGPGKDARSISLLQNLCRRLSGSFGGDMRNKPLTK